ncbi:hypothetical protein PV326_010221 [Microctonus aethiopoides]|nr:hypothetical protein PV326_010221 [Microctonus aethiopoides]
MDDVGDFIMYQDVEQSSAVVYFEKRKTLHGVIGTNYVIDDLPIELLDTCHNVGGSYVQKRKTGFHSDYNYPDVSSDIIKSFVHPKPFPNNIMNTKPSTSKQYSMSKQIINGPHFKQSKVNTHDSCSPKHNVENYYMEILVFVSYDVTELFKIDFLDEYLLEMVADYIILFNAVDMVLAKLQKHGVNININLAGIIIENEKDIFSSLFNEPGLKYSNSKSSINIDEIYIGFEDHFEKHISPFGPDSFDLIFLMTSYLIEYDGETSGLTFVIESIYDKRLETKPYRSVPITIMQYKTDYADYSTAAHEIAHALTISHDPDNIGCTNGVQCYGIMQWTNSYCFECINWSQESVDEFKIFIRENRNRCFLLNYPRSLYPIKPEKFLSPCRQCHCYGFASYGPIVNECSSEIPELGCMSPLPCMNTSYVQPIQEDTILPLDDRIKRSFTDTLPQTLEAMIIDQRFNYIHLKWNRVDSYLANENLPVWTASEYRDKLDTTEKNELNVMKNIGRFVMYQDVQSSSSVVYFEETGTLRGVIDTRYYIDDLPINLLHKCHVVGEKYVKMHKIRCHRYQSHRRVSMEILKKFSNCDLSNYFIHLNTQIAKPSVVPNKEFFKEYLDERKIESIKIDENKIRVRRDDDLSQEYYIEILLFIAYDITISL